MKLNLNAHLYHKADDYRAEPCVAEKIIEVSKDEFAQLYAMPQRNYAFISRNRDWMQRDENVNHCLLVLGEDSDDGILICSEGYVSARYSAHIPNARQLVFMEQRYNCIQGLENVLMEAAEDVLSCACNHYGEGPFRVPISDLTEPYGFDRAYIPLLADMLWENSEVSNVEVFDDEITVSLYRQEKKQEQSERLPFAPERMEHLLNKALDWIGTLENGDELYNTLTEQLGMTNEEILAARFNTLKEYFEEAGENEDAGMKME